MFTFRPAWAPVPLRLMLGISFLVHGAPKLFSPAFHDGFVGMLAGLGVPAPGLAAWAVGGVEFFGGLALLAGVAVPWAALLLLVDMVVATVTVHVPNGFNGIHITGMTDQGPVFGMPGAEYTLLFVAGLASLILSGPGRLSLGGRRGT